MSFSLSAKLDQVRCMEQQQQHLFSSTGRFNALELGKPVVAQRQSARLIAERLCVRYPLGAGLFSPSILGNVSLNRPLKEEQHYCFSYLKEMNAKLCSLGQKSLISSAWNLKKCFTIKKIITKHFRSSCNSSKNVLIDVELTILN